MNAIDRVYLPVAHDCAKLPTISVCVCTYRRPILLRRLLDRLATQITQEQFEYRCTVVDNDIEASAREVIEGARMRFPVELRYTVEPTRNFALVRNRALGLSEGELVAFIDDDEIPCADWLLRLWRTLTQSGADAVLGPVRPYFDSSPPSWILRGNIWGRKSYATGTPIHWSDTRTGNVLLKSSIVVDDRIQFNPAYALGGEDVDFFKRAAAAGRRFVWCAEAVAYELVPETRFRRQYHLRRAMLQGRISMSYMVDQPSLMNRLGIAVLAVTAIGLYACALPFAFVAGEHFGMRLLIKVCHHLARLLTVFGIPHSRSRDF